MWIPRRERRELFPVQPAIPVTTPSIGVLPVTPETLNDHGKNTQTCAPRPNGAWPCKASANKSTSRSTGLSAQRRTSSAHTTTSPEQSMYIILTSKAPSILAKSSSLHGLFEGCSQRNGYNASQQFSLHATTMAGTSLRWNMTHT